MKSSCVNVDSKKFFVDSVYGSDDNSGQTEKLAWKTLLRVNQEHLCNPFGPGDEILLRTGQTFEGSLILHNLRGSSDNKVTIGSYQATLDTKYNKPIIIPKLLDQTSRRCIFLKNCSYVSITNIEIKKGNVHISFNDEALNKQKCFSSISLSHMYFHNIDTSNVFSGALTLVATGCNKSFVNDIVIDSCRFEGIGCHSILFDVIELSNLPDIKSDKTPTTVFSHIKLTNNKTANTTSSSFKLNQITCGYISGNVILHSGKFLSDSNQLGSSGISLCNCDKITIEKNIISGSHGPKHSTAILIGPNSRLLLIQKNKSTNNFGGFISFMGGSANACIRFNVSVGDGERIKDLTRQFVPGRCVSFSDYVGWDHDSNDPIKSPVNYIYVHDNYFDVSAFTESSNTVLCSFGECRGILFERNTILTKSINLLYISLSVKSSLFEITNNVTNSKSWKLNGNYDVDSKFIPFCIENEINLTNNILNVNNTAASFNCNNSKLTQSFSDNPVRIFKEDAIGIFQSVKASDELMLNDQLPTDNKLETSLEKTINKTIFCIICYSTKKMKSLMDYFMVNQNIPFINRDMAKLFKTSPWELSSWFSNSSLLSKHKTVNEILNVNNNGFESDTFDAFLDYVFNTSVSDSIILLGDHFLVQGEPYVDSFINKISQHANLKLLLLIDNIHEDVRHKCIKRIELSEANNLNGFDINSFVSHLNKTNFVSAENVISRLVEFVGPTNFLSSDFVFSSTTTNQFSNFWKILSNKSTTFTKLFELLSTSTHSDHDITNEAGLDPVFFPYLLSRLKFENKDIQQNTISEMKLCQTKFEIKTDSCPMLNLNAKSIEACENHIQRLEKIGKFKFYKKTAFLTNGFQHTTKYIKVDFHEVDFDRAFNIYVK